MTARPILMHARSIRGLLPVPPRKTQTRRITKPQPPEDCGALRAEIINPTIVDRHGNEDAGADVFGCTTDDGDWCRPCPYGAPGDLLWVRESVLFNDEPGQGESPWIYRADVDYHEAVQIREDCNANWKPSIHMPRLASRLTLRLTDVRVERVRQISEADIAAEGIEPNPPHPVKGSEHAKFAQLWDDTNGHGAWERNDYVWVLAFEVLRENVDAVLRRLKVAA